MKKKNKPNQLQTSIVQVDNDGDNASGKWVYTCKWVGRWASQKVSKLIHLPWLWSSRWLSESECLSCSLLLLITHNSLYVSGSVPWYVHLCGCGCRRADIKLSHCDDRENENCMLKKFLWWYVWLEFLEINDQNLICYHWLSVLGNSE